jgi:POT family proton-dependent oligopeptide transporter
MDAVYRKPVATRGAFDAAHASVSTYALVGPAYFMFFAELLAVVGVGFILIARRYRERTSVRAEAVA